MRCVDEYTGMLRSDDGFDDRGEIVDIWKGFYAEEDVVEGAFDLLSSFFWGANNCGRCQLEALRSRGRLDIDEPCLGLKRSLPNRSDLYYDNISPRPRYFFLTSLVAST